MKAEVKEVNDPATTLRCPKIQPLSGHAAELMFTA